MNILESIKKKIFSAMNVSILNIIDQSDLHVGHKFVSISSVSHIKIFLVSDDLFLKNYLDRHRFLHNILEKEILLTHSITFSLYTVGEYLLKGYLRN